MFEFTWLMINVAYLCSCDQIQKLRPVLIYLTQIYEMQPGNTLFAFANFVKRELDMFELLVDGGALEKIAKEKL